MKLLLFKPTIFTDERGLFLESFHKERYEKKGILTHFVQDNLSHSKKNVIRGLHYQLPFAQGKLVYVSHGRVFDVVVDIRKGSPTFGRNFSFILDDIEHQQLYIPPGFAHGFCALSDEVDFVYKCTDYYHPETEKGILWNDPALKIQWPITHPLLSPKDNAFPLLKNIPLEDLPLFEDLQK